MGSYPAPFYVNLFFFFYECTWLKSIRNANSGVVRKFGNIFRFIDDLIAIKDKNEFQNHYKKVCPLQLIWEKGNTSNRDYFSRHSSLYK